MTYSRRSDDEWRNLITECKSSGLSDAEWLKIKGIAPSTYYKKLHILFGTVEENTLLPQKDLPKIPENHEVVQLTFDGSPVTFKNNEPAPAVSADVIVNFGGFSVEIMNSADSGVIHNTISAIRSLC